MKSYQAPDTQPVTLDGYINISACLWEFPDTSTPGFPRANFEGLGNPACKDIGAGVVPQGMACIEYGILVGGQYGAVLVNGITDDVFGLDIGGFLCTDRDHDSMCGDPTKGEVVAAFCSQTALHNSPGDTDGDGHLDWGHAVYVFVDGPLNQGWLHQTVPDEVDGAQAGDCSTTQNPIGGTRGTIKVVFSG